MSVRDFTEQDIHLALDGELPAEEAGAYAAWLDANPDMKARAVRFEADRDRLRAAVAGVLEEPIPARLVAAVSDEAMRPRTRPNYWRAAAAAAVLLLAGGLGGYAVGSGVLRGGPGDAAEQAFVARAIEAHVLYAAEKLHVVEVGADQSDHLIGWLSKRVGLDLVAPDFTSEGLRFLGGRLLPAGENKAAQFMYEDDAGNRVSLYITADKGAADTGFRLAQEDGAAAYYWLDDGYGCAISGTVAPQRLLAVANIAYKQLLGGAHS